ncbi:hypothetical protein T492DRAFT_335736 [Pavlovales sp. CCMP2436]|nr:hypothetical protein T492DRAFT_335736 [Pavlovales sp. CCMP2436]|mmetsp:Transcript_24938/g.63235  ORF Transcript_24938/g.63235 Transcript_24938/m.63235 type:complete len:223 (+) Transcript_24938:2325-2993(+)
MRLDCLPRLRGHQVEHLPHLRPPHRASLRRRHAHLPARRPVASTAGRRQRAHDQRALRRGAQATRRLRRRRAGARATRADDRVRARAARGRRRLRARGDHCRLGRGGDAAARARSAGRLRRLREPAGLGHRAVACRRVRGACGPPVRVHTAPADRVRPAGALRPDVASARASHYLGHGRERAARPHARGDGRGRAALRRREPAYGAHDALRAHARRDPPDTR